MPWRSCHSAHQDVSLKLQNALTKLYFKTIYLTHFYFKASMVKAIKMQHLFSVAGSLNRLSDLRYKTNKTVNPLQIHEVNSKFRILI